MKRIKNFEGYDRTDIFGKGRRAYDNSDDIEKSNKLPDPAGFDLDLKTDELDNNMENLVSKFGIGKVKNWIENYLR